jgi:two-component system NtrC family sensor kinase
VKLALKLALAILPGALAVIAAAAVLDLRRDAADFDADQRQDDLAMARVLATTVGRTWDDRGKDRALVLLEPMRGLAARFRVRWVDLGDPRSALSPAEREKIGRGEEVLWHKDSDAPGWLHALSPVRSGGAVVGAIDLSEAPTDLRAHVRGTIRATLVTVLALSATMVLVTLFVGAWVVGRPVTALITQARRVAAGDLRARSVPHQRDELGELTRELNGMLDRLEQAAAAVRASTEQRFAALEQLRHAERLTTVGRLASSVAHELGTPLNVVAGRARLITEEDHDASKHAGIIIEQSTRMTKIIRQLLDYARRQPPEKERQDLRRLAAQALTLLETLAAKRGVMLRLESDLADVPVIADATQIQQALTNLLVNAIQASRTGATVDVVLRAASARPASNGKRPDGVFYEVSVQDHGQGMAPDVLSRVFEPFFTTKPVGESTGLGLSVANDIVEEHGGWITAESEPGRGSRFSLFLPRGVLPRGSG